MPSLKALKDCGHKISVNPAKQHVKRKISTSSWGVLLFTCDTFIAEFKSIDLNTKKAECLDKLFVCANLSQLRLYTVL